MQRCSVWRCSLLTFQCGGVQYGGVQCGDICVELRLVDVDDEAVRSGSEPYYYF